MKTTYSTVMRTLLVPRSATILTPLRGLAVSLRGLQPPHSAVNMLEEVLATTAGGVALLAISVNVRSGKIVRGAGDFHCLVVVVM